MMNAYVLYPLTWSSIAIRSLLFCVLIVVFGTLAANADDYAWTGSGDGTSFDMEENWSPDGHPGSGDNVTFGLGSTYTVLLSEDETVDNTRVNSGVLTLDLGGNEYSTSTLRIASGGFVTVTNGTFVQTFNNDSSGIGYTGTGDGEMLVTGANTHFSGQYIRIGQQAKGVLRFEDGATGSFVSGSLQFTIGRFGSGTDGTLVVSGVNTDDPLNPKRSSVTTSGSLYISSLSGGGPRGAVFVEDGAYLEVDGTIFLTTGDGSAFLISSGQGSEIETTGSISVSNNAGINPSWLIARSDGLIRAASNINVYAEGNVGGDGAIVTTSGTLFNGGLVAPGDPTLSYSNLSVTRNYTSSIGTLIIDGNYAQSLVVNENTTLLGTLSIKIESEDSHDQLYVTGDVSLAGTLDLVEFGTVTLSLGDELQILSWDGTLQGTFGTINAFDLDEGLSWNFDRLYTDGIISVVPEPSVVAYAVVLGVAALIIRRRKR